MTTIGRNSGLFIVAIGLTGCCDENVRVMVLPGRQDARMCMQAVKEGRSSPMTVDLTRFRGQAVVFVS